MNKRLKIILRFFLIFIWSGNLAGQSKRFLDEFYSYRFDPDLYGNVKGICTYQLTEEGKNLKSFNKRKKLCRSFFYDPFQTSVNTFRHLKACADRLHSICQITAWTRFATCYPFGDPPVGYSSDEAYVKISSVCISPDDGEEIY